MNKANKEHSSQYNHLHHHVQTHLRNSHWRLPRRPRSQPGTPAANLKGLVNKIDYSTKSVSVVTPADSTADTASSYGFDYLVSASGSTTPATTGVKLPFKAIASKDTRQAIHEALEKLGNSRTTVIGGAGPLRVEIAGELAEAPGSKKVTLVS